MLIRASLLIAFAVANLVTATGCAENEEAKTLGTEFVGTWQEVPEATQSVGVTKIINSQPPPFLRQITIQADGTFKMHLTDLEGNVLEDVDPASGKWAQDGLRINFEPTDPGSLDSNEQGYVPMYFLALDLTSRGADADRLHLKDARNMEFKLVRNSGS
jgi:hypothetical protein